MPAYILPKLTEPAEVDENVALLVASGDLRETANQECWPAQAEMEARITSAFGDEGIRVVRAHPVNATLGHGFISSQRMGMDIFRTINKDARIIVAEAVWQYSYHVLAGLRDHRGPILTIANWSGQWPGLVGLLNLNASLTKMGVEFSSIWSESFDDAFFLDGIRQWLAEGRITHDDSHVRKLQGNMLPKNEQQLGQALARQMVDEKVIMGIFDEGCMGMYNAFIDDELLNPMGIYKERLSQSALVAAMHTVSDQDAQGVRDWLDGRNLKFITGPNPETDLTDDQILEQCKMYIAAVRMADFFGCDTIGIQYQQGLKDMTPASDLVEGLLNNSERPPIFNAEGEELFPGQPLPHFNEVDECHAVDALVTQRVMNSLELAPETTLHDVRYGERYQGEGIDDFVWTLMISGAFPAAHIKGGYAGAFSTRQPGMYFRMGGGTLAGVGKAGEIVWSRVFVEDQKVQIDIGRGRGLDLPDEEVNRRWAMTSPEWPNLSMQIDGVSRDQFMARHRSNHISVVYAPSVEDAERIVAVKAAFCAELGIEVHFCGI
jgi:hypothetical protein